MRPYLAALVVTTAAALSAQAGLPSEALAMRDFRLQFDPTGTFSLGGDPEWTAMSGTWTTTGRELTLQNQTGPKECAVAARYRWIEDGPQFGLDVIDDACVERRMILDRSRWLPQGIAVASYARKIVRTAGTITTPLKDAA